MYAIRVDTVQGLIEVEFSGRLATSEALRAISQAFTLAEAGAIRSARCDTRRLDRGPAGAMVIAASLAVRFPPGLRLAFVARDDQRRYLSRILRFSGLKEGIRVFAADEESGRWLLPASRARENPASTEQRHARKLLSHQLPARTAAGGRETAAAAAEARHSAA